MPVILTRQDTYTVIEMLGSVSRHIKPTDKVGISIALDNVNRFVDWDYLLKLLGE